MAEKWIYWFEELGSEHYDLVGKKCANLGEMTRLGMRVPPGFAVSVEGYEKFMAKPAQGKRSGATCSVSENLLGQVGKQMEASRKIREIIESKKMPSEMPEEYR